MYVEPHAIDRANELWGCETHFDVYQEFDRASAIDKSLVWELTQRQPTPKQQRNYTEEFKLSHDFRGIFVVKVPWPSKSKILETVLRLSPSQIEVLVKPLGR